MPAEVAMFGDAGLEEEAMGGLEQEQEEDSEENDLIGALCSDDGSSFRPEDTDEEEEVEEDEESDDANGNKDEENEDEDRDA